MSTEDCRLGQSHTSRLAVTPVGRLRSFFALFGLIGALVGEGAASPHYSRVVLVIDATGSMCLPAKPECSASVDTANFRVTAAAGLVERLSECCSRSEIGAVIYPRSPRLKPFVPLSDQSQVESMVAYLDTAGCDPGLAKKGGRSCATSASAALASYPLAEILRALDDFPPPPDPDGLLHYVIVTDGAWDDSRGPDTILTRFREVWPGSAVPAFHSVVLFDSSQHGDFCYKHVSPHFATLADSTGGIYLGEMAGHELADGLIQILDTIVARMTDTMPEPVAAPSGSTFDDSIQVSLSVPGDTSATISYTADGSDPSSVSAVWGHPLWFTETTTLKARTEPTPGTPWLPSPVLVEVYTRRGTRAGDGEPPRRAAAGSGDDCVMYAIDGRRYRVGSPYSGRKNVSGHRVVILRELSGTTPGKLHRAIVGP